MSNNNYLVNECNCVTFQQFVQLKLVKVGKFERNNVKRYGFADIDECESEPCKNGASCHNMINSYRCSCADGFTGHICDNGMARIAKNSFDIVFIHIAHISFKSFF